MQLMRVYDDSLNVRQNIRSHITDWNVLFKNAWIPEILNAIRLELSTMD